MKEETEGDQLVILKEVETLFYQVHNLKEGQGYASGKPFR